MKKLSFLQWIFAVLGLFMAISCFASGGTGIIGGLIVLLSAIWVSPIMGKYRCLPIREKSVRPFSSSEHLRFFRSAL